MQIIGVKADGSTVSNPTANKGANKMEYGGQTYYYSTDETTTPTANDVFGPEERADLGVHATPADAAQYLLTKIDQFDITYDANGGAGPALPTGHKKLAGLPFTIPEVKGLSKDSNALTGWNTAADGSGTAYALGAAVTEDENVTLYAQYDTSCVTVTLDQNGGTSGTESVLAVPGEMMPALGALPLKSNCTFAGYYDVAGVQYYDGSGDPVRRYPAAGGPAKLTAKWANGLGIFAGRFSQYQVFDCHRTPAYPTANQSFRVFQFANPFTDSGKVMNGKKATIGQMSDSQINGKIFYFQESGDSSNPFILWFADSAEQADDGGGVQVSKAGKIYSLGKEGFLFVSSTGNDYGYFISLNQAFNKGDEITYRPTNPGPITTDDAKDTPADPDPWTPNGSYTVAFDSNGATVVATPSKISVRKPETGAATLGNLPANPTKTGYAFNGWYTAKTGGAKFDAYTTPITQNMTVYAQWVKAQNTTTSIALYKDDTVWTGQTVQVQTVSGSGLTGSLITASYSSRTKTYVTASGAVSAAGTYAVLVGGKDTGARFTHAAGAADTVEVKLYSVSYRANSVTGNVPDGSVELAGSPYTVLFTPAPTKTDCTFVGWTDRPAGQQMAENDGYQLYQTGGVTTLNVAGVTTLIAVFKQPAPTVGDSSNDFSVTQPDTTSGKGTIALNPGHGAPDDYEYSIDNGKTWTPWPEGNEVEAGQGEDVLIRRPNKGSDLASDPVTATIETIQFMDDFIEVTGYTGVYDGNSYSIAVSATGDALGATITYSEKQDGTYTTVNPGYKDAGTHTVFYKVEKEGYQSVVSSAQVVIRKKAVSVQSVSVSDKTYDGDCTTANGAITLDGVVNNEAVTASGTIVFTSKDVGNDKTVDVTSIVLSGEAAKNYVMNSTTASNVSTTAKITPKAVELSWTNTNTKTYDGAPADVRATVSSGLVPGDVCQVNVTGGNQVNAGTHTAAAESLSNSNYKLPDTGTTQNYTIQKAKLTATYEGATLIYKENIPESAKTVSVTGFVNGETAGNAGGYHAPTVTLPNNLTPDNEGNPATEKVTPTGGSATNYEFIYVAGNFTVLSRDFNVVLVKDYEGDYDGKSHGLTVVNEDDETKSHEVKVQYATNGTDWSDTAPSRTEAGTTTVQFKISAKGFTPQEGTATINIRPKKVTPTMSNGTTRVYDGTTDAADLVTLGLTGVLADDANAVTLTAGTVAFADKNVGQNKSVTADSLKLEGDKANNYVLSDSTVSGGGTELGAGITAKEVTLTWKNTADRAYDGSPSTVTAEANNLVVNDTCTVTVNGGQEKDAGTHTATATALSNGNYKLPDTLPTQAYTISQAVLTAKFTDESIVFGNKPALVIDVSGFQGSEDATSAADYTAPIISGDIPTHVGTYTITLTGGSAKNYTFDLKTGTLTITNADMSGGVNSYGYTGVYDGQPHGITVTAPDGAAITYYSDENCTQERQNAEQNVTAGTTIYYKVVRENYADVTGSQTIVITPKKVTPSLGGTIADRDYNGTTGTSGGTLTLSGVAATETVTAGGTIAFTSPDAGKNKTVEITGITLSGGTADNYELTTTELKGVATEAEIRPKEVSLTWTDTDGLVYTGNQQSVSATVNNLEADDSCTVTVTGGTERNAGSYTATATGLDNPNYKLPDPAPTRAFTIQPAKLTATYKSETIKAATLPALVVEVTGFVENESADNAADYTAPRIPAESVPVIKGTHTLTPSGGSAKNYTFTYVEGTLTITDNPILGVTADAYEGLYDHAMHDGVKVNGVQEGDMVQYSTDGGNSWSSEIPQVGPVSDTPIQIKVTRPEYEELVINVTASVKSAPIVQLDRPKFDENDLQKVTLGGSVTESSYEVVSQTFEYRKVGDTQWIPLDAGQTANGKTTYEQTVSSLTPDTEYEVRLTATDVKGNTASESLLFKTQRKNPPTGVIEGSVEDPDDMAEITVTIELGNTIVASKDKMHTGDKFKFEHLEDGEYNLVATDGTYKVTQMVTVVHGGTTTLGVVKVGAKQSVVKVEDNAPPVAVDGLKELFNTPLYQEHSSAPSVVENGGTVEIRLTAAEAKTEHEITQIREKAAGKVEGLLVDLTVDMILMPENALSTVEPVPETDALLTIAIPIPREAQGRSGYQLFRYHDGQVDALKQIAVGGTPTVESFYVSGRYAYVFAQKFSTYALYYTRKTGGGSSGGTGNPTPEQKPQDDTKPVSTPDETGADQWLNVQDHMAYVIGSADGLVHPQSSITRAEVAMIFYRLLQDDVRAKYETSTNRFSDAAADAWYNAAVSTLTNAGILAGRSDGTFGPDRPITRAEFAAIASRFSSLAYRGDDLFTDIAGHWARNEINRAASYGWVNGVGDGIFAPDRTITRAEAIAIINRVLGRLPETADDLLPGMKTWPDNADRDKWYYLAIQEATNGHTYDRKKNEPYETWKKLSNPA